MSDRIEKQIAALIHAVARRHRNRLTRVQPQNAGVAADGRRGDQNARCRASGDDKLFAFKPRRYAAVIQKRRRFVTERRLTVGIRPNRHHRHLAVAQLGNRQQIEIDAFFLNCAGFVGFVIFAIASRYRHMRRIIVQDDAAFAQRFRIFVFFRARYPAAVFRYFEPHEGIVASRHRVTAPGIGRQDDIRTETPHPLRSGQNGFRLQIDDINRAAVVGPIVQIEVRTDDVGISPVRVNCNPRRIFDGGKIARIADEFRRAPRCA